MTRDELIERLKQLAAQEYDFRRPRLSKPKVIGAAICVLLDHKPREAAFLAVEMQMLATVERTRAHRDLLLEAARHLSGHRTHERLMRRASPAHALQPIQA
jgi:hypothetical protein